VTRTWVVAAMWGRDVVLVSRRAAPVWPKCGQWPGRSTAAVEAARWWWWLTWDLKKN